MLSKLKILTPRELKAFMREDWPGFRHEMAKRLMRVGKPKQHALIELDTLLAGRFANRELFCPELFLRRFGQLEEDLQMGYTASFRAMIQAGAETKTNDMEGKHD